MTIFYVWKWKVEKLIIKLQKGQKFAMVVFEMNSSIYAKR